MRNFILGKTLASNGTALGSVAAGAVGFGYIDPSTGILKVTTDGSKIAKKGYFVLGRSSAQGGPVVLPVYANNFSYSVGEYVAAETFEGTITVPETIVAGEEYTVIVVKKGVKFNERNKWTASVVAKDSDDASSIAEALIDLINANSESSGVEADADGEDDTIIVVTAKESGVDYTLIGADHMTDAEVEITDAGTPAYGDASYVRDLANKAAADAGFEYTYMGDVNYLYPDYPLNPLKQADAEDTGFSIITMRFAEQREVKTVEDVVNQIIQVAIPSGVTLTNLVNVCKALAGETV